MYLYYNILNKEDAKFYQCYQSSIQEGTGGPLPWHNPSECIFRVPNKLNDWSTEIGSEMARAAGTRTAEGIAMMGRVIKSYVDDGYSVHSALGRAMITADEIWSDDEISAITEAFKEEAQLKR